VTWFSRIDQLGAGAVIDFVSPCVSYRHRVDDRDLPRPLDHVKRWRDGTMALHWCAAGMLEAKKQFSRVNGHRHLHAFRAALAEDVAASVTPDHDADHKEVAA
jgi:hypothetical protein